MTKRGPRSSNRARALEMFLSYPDMSDGAIAGEIGVSRQLVSRWRKPFRKPPATDQGETVADADGQTRFAASQANAPQPATSGNAIERQRLMDLASEDQQLEVLVDKILRGSAPRAAAIAVGIEGRAFSKRMEADSRFRGLVLRAAHEAESSVAQNLYRLATGSSPQAAQSAIAWLEKRMEDWRPGAQRIEIDVQAGIDVRAIMSGPHAAEWIERVNELEMLMQQAELPAHGDVIEGEIVERVESRPELPDEEVTRVREDPIFEHRRNRPGMSGSGTPRFRQGDELAPGDDDRPAF